MPSKPSSKNTLRIAFIGFGEVGQRFARDLSNVDGIALAAFDLKLLDKAQAAALTSAAKSLGVATAPTAAAACADAHVIMSAVTADQTAAVAAAAAVFLKPGQIFFDVNSAAPTTKQQAAAAIARSGADYVEGAVMAAVLQPGLAVPILAGGPAAARTAALLNPLGMKLTPVATTYGRASAIKLCRSIVIKGLEALMVDCAAATKHWDVEADVYASLDATYPSIDWQALAADMGERVATHGVRRSAEMHEAADMVADMGRSPDLTRAVAVAQRLGAKRK